MRRAVLIASAAAAALVPSSAWAQDGGPLRFEQVATGVLGGDFAVHGGYLAWQSYSSAQRRYLLRMRRAGRTRTIATGTRPFGGFDLAPGPRGRMVVAFSRCAPRRGCDVWWRHASSGPARRVPGAASPRVSEGLPTVWGGRVAFSDDVRADVREESPPGYYRVLGRNLTVRSISGSGPVRRTRLAARCGSSEGRNLGPDALQLRGNSLLYVLFCGGPSTVDGDQSQQVAYLRNVSTGRARQAFTGLGFISGFDFGPGGRPYFVGLVRDGRAGITGLRMRVGGEVVSDPEIPVSIEQVRVDRSALFASRCPSVATPAVCTVERATNARLVNP